MKDDAMRSPQDIEAYPYSEIDMDMHVDAVTADLRAEIERLLAVIAIIEQNDASRGPSYPADDGDYCQGRCIMPKLRAACKSLTGREEPQ